MNKNTSVDGMAKATPAETKPNRNEYSPRVEEILKNQPMSPHSKGEITIKKCGNEVCVD